MSLEYPKTENLFKRDEATHKLIRGDLRLPEFGLIHLWHVTEKIDGTNMRVVYDPLNQTVEVRGRSDRANIAGDLKDYMIELFSVEKLSAQFDEFITPERIADGTTVTIFGEGYGAGIQQGGGYNPAKRFRAFDVCYHWKNSTGPITERDSWCQASTVTEILKELEVPRVPYIGLLSLQEIVDFVDAKRGSITAFEDTGNKEHQPEGIIARTDPYLYTERGSRLMFKLKGVDIW